MALSRETVIAAALQLLDKSGLDGLSTRRLAQELGVEGPALYWHFKNKRELLDHVAEAIVEVGLRNFDRVVATGNWQTWLAELARCNRAAILSRRDGARILAGCRPASSIGGVSFAKMTDSLQQTGFTEQEARYAILVVGRYALGWTTDEQAAADRPRSVDPTLGFEFGLEVIIAGLESRIASHPVGKPAARRSMKTRASKAKSTSKKRSSIIKKR